MTRRNIWMFLAAAVALALVVTLVVFRPAAERESAEGGQAGQSGEREMPTALGQHLERLRDAIPGDGGESHEGPGSSADAEFEARAYPADTISVEQMATARQSAASTAGRPFPKGKGVKGSWVSVGPSQALYPASPFRNSASYVPNAYNAAGRTTAIAIGSVCVSDNCPIWVALAGGGVWRANDGLSAEPKWRYLSGPFGTNTVGSLTIDPNDASGKTVYVGTGEANVCGSGCVAGIGIYKTTDGGTSWTGPLGQSELGGKGIGSIAVAPGNANTIYAGTTTALRGMSSSCCSGVTRPVPGAAKWGLYKSTDGGQTWSFIHDGSANASECVGDAAEYGNARPCSPRGVRQVVLDPVDPNVVYAGSFSRGVWRSGDGGGTWTQIKEPLSRSATVSRPMIAVNALPNGDTRMYVGEGATGSPYSRLFRSDSVRTGVPGFTDLTSPDQASQGYGSFNYCTGQCWYDNFVVSPAGQPDMVYLGGSYQYGETGGVSNGRGVVLSTDAGASFTDMTMDATDPVHPNGLHPDQHTLVVNPSNPSQFFEGSDGGVMRSSGQFADVSSWCDSRSLSATSLARCKQLLSRVPSRLSSMNKGLPTLQFISLSVSPQNVNVLQGGTQDNGTWQSTGNPVKWENTMIGDGGQSGFDIADSNFRFHTFYDASPDVNFSGGATSDWNWIADPIFGTGSQFYAPIITDPAVSKTMFAGTANAWRTKTWGMGTMTREELRQHCNEWTGDFAVRCGDWEQIASPSLNSGSRGDRAGGSVVAIERTKADSSSAWAATQTGRVFVSKDLDAEPAGAVTWTRIDTAATPNRYVTGIYVDPADGNHAWISYSGYNSATPTTSGHVFEVRFDPRTGTATWTDRSYDVGDLPITDIVRDDVNGDLYAASDLGVFRLASGTTSWTAAAPGMPKVEVAGLTIVPGQRKLFAATHGLSAWMLNLP